MRVSIFGLGHIGAVIGACMADSGHEAMIVDHQIAKIRSVRAGRAPVVEPNLDEMFSKNVAAGRLKATDDYMEAVMNTDISLICMDGHTHDGGSHDLREMCNACRQIGVALAKKDDWHVVVLRSPVAPGMARRHALPILAEASGKEPGMDFGFGNNPEFLREGMAIHDYFNPPKIVIGATDERAARALLALYAGVEAPKIITGIESAERTKYAENARLDTKTGNIIQPYGVDSSKALDVF